MREFNNIFRESLENGMRPNNRVNRGRPFLVRAFNLMASEYGLEPAPVIDDPFDGGINVSHPFPQLFVGKGDSFLLEESGIKSVDMSTDPWSVITLNTFDGRNSSSSKTISSGGVWQFIDMQDSWYMLNGESIVFDTGHRNIIGKDDKILVLDDITINAGTYHRGRVIIGGFDENDFWNINWQSLFQHWKDSVGEQIPFDFGDIGNNFVFWSSIGGGDFPLWLFYPELAVEGFSPQVDDKYDYNLENSMLLEAMRKNEFGFMPMPWQGTVEAIVPLGDNLIVYGDEGVSALTPISVTQPQMVPPTYGLRHISDIGIAGRGAVGGGERFPHAYVGQDGKLWRITSDLQKEKIDFENLFVPMLGEDILVTVDEQLGNYYVTDGTDCYLLDSGVTEVKHRPTSLEFRQGGLTGVFTEKNDDSAIVVTNTFDVGVRGNKTITGVLLGVDTSSSVEVAIDYRNDKGGGFTRSVFFPVNKEGFAESRVNGLEFRLVIKADNYTDFNLDYAEVRYQIDDRRHIRGTTAGVEEG